MTFNEFMKHVHKRVGIVAGGLGADDFADVLWHDLYDDTDKGAEVTDEQIYELLAEGDDIFASIYELHQDGQPK